MPSLLDIHASLSYSVIAPYVGLEPVDIYTSSSKCPYCGENAWTIYQDTKSLEESHYCYSCKKVGTILELAAERLELSQVETIKYLYTKLNYTLRENALEDFLTVQNRQARLNSIWHKAQQEMLKPTQPGLNILAKFGLKPDRMSTERLLNGPAALYGTLTGKLLREEFFVRCKTLHRAGLVVPCYKNAKDIGYIALTTPEREITPGLRLRTSDLAFSGLQIMHRFQSPFVIVTSMLRNSLQLQNFNFVTSDVPLPVLGWKQALASLLKSQWSILDGRLPIFWERQPTPLILHQAMMLGAKISFVGPDVNKKQNECATPAEWLKWLRHDPPPDIIRRISDNSKPCEQALSNWLKTASHAQRSQLMLDADNFNDSVSKLVRSHLDPRFRSKFARRVNIRTKARGGKLGTHGHTVIVERDGMWFNLNGTVKLPGIIRVSHLVIRPDGVKEHVGVFHIHGKKIPFRVDEKNASLRYFMELGFKNGVPVFVPIEGSIWNDKNTENFDPLEAACRLETPQIVKGLDRIGWDKEGFQLSNAKIVKGVFKSVPEYTFAENVPGPKRSYCKLTDDVKEALQKSGVEMEIIWAFAIAMCAQITAVIGKKTPYGIALNREDYDVFLHQLLNRFDISDGPTAGWKHAWPRKIESITLATKKSTDNFFVAFNDKPGTLETVEVDVNDQELQPRLLSHSADKIAMNYLKHFTQLDIPKGIRMYKGWLEFTRKTLGEVFDFVPAETLDRAFNRLKVNS